MRSQVDSSYFREHLPPNASIQELSHFLQDGFVPPLSQSFLPQVAVSSALLIVLVFLGVTTITSRLLKRTFWIFKLDQKAEGTMITFNSTNSFVCFQIVYILSFLAMLWCWTGTAKFGLDPGRVYYSIPLPFIALISGAYISTCGAYQSVSQVIALPIKGSKNDTLKGSFTPSPKVSNGFAFGAPFFVAATIIAAAIVTGRTYQIAESKFQHFQTLVQNQPLDSMPNSEQIESAAQVFEQISKSFYVLAIVFVIWTVWACVFTLSFIFFGTLIMKSLKMHLKQNNNNVNTINFPTFDATVTTFYPSRVIPEGVEELNDKNNRPINKKAKTAVLHSAVKLILLLGFGILVGAIGFSAISSYAAARLYELSLRSPREVQINVARLLLSATWLTVIAGGFTFFLITASTFQPILEGYHQAKRNVRLFPQPVSSIFSRLGRFLGILSPEDDDGDEEQNRSSSLALSAVKGSSRNPSPPPGVHVQTIHTQVSTILSSRSNNNAQTESGILDHERLGRTARRSSEDLNGPWHSRTGRHPSPSGVEILNGSENSLKTTPSRFSDEIS